jgi:LETM1 and EF-hand domain-containing protein 1
MTFSNTAESILTCLLFPQEPQDDVRITNQQLQELRAALAVLSSKSAILEQREELKELEVDHEEYKEVRFYA